MPGLLDPNDDGLISPEERKQIAMQNLFSGLLQGGLQMVAAGENLQPWQRAQMLGQVGQTIGGIPGGIQQGMQNAAQQKLLGQKYADKKRESELMNSPEFLSSIADMPKELQVLARTNVPAFIAAAGNWRQMQMQDQRERAAAERQAQKEAAQAAREPPKITHDEYGRPIGWDPISRTWMPISTGASGDMRSAYGLPGGGSQQQGAASGGPAGPPNTSAATSATVPVDQTADYTNVFGPAGWYHRAANTVRGVFDGPSEGNAKAQNAQDNWSQVRLSAIKALSAEVPGRSSKYAAQIVGETLPESAAFFTGPDKAVSKIKAAQNTIDGEIASLESGMNAPGNLQNRAKMAENLRDLYRVRENLQTVAEKVKPPTDDQNKTGGVGLPNGATVVGKTRDGRTVYSLNGQQYVK